jgi:hypothetical protein
MVGYNDPDPGHPAEVDENGASLWKFQVKITVKLAKAAGGDIREFATLAGTTIQSLSELIETWEAERTNADGGTDQLPVVKLTGAKPIKGSHGTNFQAEWQTTGWMARPADMARAANGNGKAATTNGNGSNAVAEFDDVQAEPASVADDTADSSDDGLPF